MKQTLPGFGANRAGVSVAQTALPKPLCVLRFFAPLRLVSFCLGIFLPSSLHAEAQTNWSFRNHVQPVLAKNGCSSGACHGAAAGQNGFKLSLRGYDDEGDYLALTRAAFGRRIIPSDSGRSLLLQITNHKSEKDAERKAQPKGEVGRKIYDRKMKRINLGAA